MIAKLRGIVDSIAEDSLIIDVGGIGYSVLVTARLLSTIKIGDNISLRIYHAFKAEQQFLCGFQTENEIVLFKNLLNVPGIGIKSALAILSKLAPEELAIAIASQDSNVLLSISGIGKKNAARILLELKDKTMPEISQFKAQYAYSINVNDAMLGLISLGYNKNQIFDVISKVIDHNNTNKDLPSNELIVLCLRELQ